jgi:hypothetical protein
MIETKSKIIKAFCFSINSFDLKPLTPANTMTGTITKLETLIFSTLHKIGALKRWYRIRRGNSQLVRGNQLI